MFPPYDKSPFVFEYFSKSVQQVYCFGQYNGFTIDGNLKFSYMTSNKYNGSTIKQGIGGDYTNTLCLFTFSANGAVRSAKVVLYALEIYPRDLTEAEIQIVKDRMIKQYEAKTGETFELNI